MEVHLNQVFEFSHHVINKQMNDLDLSPKDMGPAEADQFIQRVSEALTIFLGASSTKLVKRALKENLRRHAPEYYHGKYHL